MSRAGISRRTRVSATLVCASAAAVVVAGCGSSSKSATPAAATSSAAAGAASPAVKALLATATASYADYVRAQVDQLVTNAQALDAAIKTGSLTAAAAAYPAGRVNYEQIEPVAESFGDLDPNIDARIDDPHPSGTWEGFHRIEQALYANNTLTGMQAVADQLVVNCQKLQTLVKNLTYQPAELGNGATSLLDEVGKTKVTGEEERYSHLDLLDMEANVQGARVAFTDLQPALKITDPALATKTDAAFTAFEATIAPYKQGTGWVSYTKVTADERKQISTSVNALAEPLSQLAAAVV
jgi:iron uptake system component EfeO